MLALFSNAFFGRLILSTVCLLPLSCVVVSAQPPTRAAEVEALRDAKSSQLGVEEPSPGEKAFVGILRNPVLDALFGKEDGLHLGIGGLPAGMGFALGPNWKMTDLLDGNLNLHAIARASIGQSYLGSFRANLPNLFNGYAQVDFEALHQNLNRLPYYGEGPRSRRTGRSAYRLEETTLMLRPAIRPFRHLLLGGIGGAHLFNVGPTASENFISTERQFPTTPGVDRQGNFWRSGAFAVYDKRRGGTEPFSGTRAEAEYVRLTDREFGAFSHSRLDVDVQQYIPFFNDRRVIALRAHTTLTDARRGQSVPFYLQPHVGGPTTLRGFRPFRFYDANAFYLNGEYRFETNLGLDMAIFADGGKVFPDWSQLNFERLEGSFGAGLRVKMRQNLVMRLDLGVSREGVMLWFRFDNIF